MSIKQTVLEKARYRCQKCSVKLTGAKSPHFQHINGSNKDNRPTNLRALCDTCFEPLRKKESRKGMMGNFRNNLDQVFGK
jgi:5-methylcytosine-specific restriction protein A